MIEVGKGDLCFDKIDEGIQSLKKALEIVERDLDINFYEEDFERAIKTAQKIKALKMMNQSHLRDAHLLKLL